MASFEVDMRAAFLISLALIAPASAAEWHKDYVTAKAEAKRTGKPLFVVFRCEP